jgi:AbrB family transcriptional regulator (stage V sporulation protein T)
MKATGIIRRIDDLGRVVIPKEIRRTLRIRNGDPLEIFVDREGEVILKKYSIIGELDEFAQEYTDSLNQGLGHISLVCDRDTIIAVSGTTKKEFLNKTLVPVLGKVIEERKTSQVNDKRDPYFDEIAVIDESEKFVNANKVVAPIIVEGDAIGAVILIAKEPGVRMGDVELKMAGTAATFLSKQMET